MLIKNNAVVLFQGDSVTDCGRLSSLDGLGTGYVMQAVSRFMAMYPHKNVKFINRGISGDRVKDLKRRWQEDCLDLKPDVVSILIGINDCWRRYDSNDPTYTEDYEKSYREILKLTKKELTANVIILEPFLLPYPEDRDVWREDLDPKIHATRKLAREFGAVYIPLDGLFAQASTQKEPAFWAADGVHPTNAGHSLIAQAWLGAVGVL